MRDPLFLPGTTLRLRLACLCFTIHFAVVTARTGIHSTLLAWEMAYRLVWLSDSEQCTVILLKLDRFTSFGFDWPPVLVKLFSIASLSSFNDQLLAPECSVGGWGFKLKCAAKIALSTNLAIC